MLVPGEVPSKSDASSPAETTARKPYVGSHGSPLVLEKIPWLHLQLDLKLSMTFFMEEQWLEANAHGVRVALARRDGNVGWTPRGDPSDEVLIEPFDTDATYSWCVRRCLVCAPCCAPPVRGVATSQPRSALMAP